MTDIGHRRGATGTESGRLLSDSNMHLRPELEDQIEHTIASLIARQNRSPHARPWIGWVNEMPREILTDPIPERPGECHRLMAEVEGWLTDLGSIPAPLEWTPREIIEASDFDHVSAWPKPWASTGNHSRQRPQYYRSYPALRVIPLPTLGVGL